MTSEAFRPDPFAVELLKMLIAIDSIVNAMERERAPHAAELRAALRWVGSGSVTTDEGNAR